MEISPKLASFLSGKKNRNQGGDNRMARLISLIIAIGWSPSKIIFKIRNNFNKRIYYVRKLKIDKIFTK